MFHTKNAWLGNTYTVRLPFIRQLWDSISFTGGPTGVIDHGTNAIVNLGMGVPEDNKEITPIWMFPKIGVPPNHPF